MMALAGKWLLTVRTLALLLHVVFDLVRRHDLLDRGQQLFRLIQTQPKRLWQERTPLETGNLFDV